MARRNAAPLIPLTTPGYKGKLTAKQQTCIAWKVVSDCHHADAFVAFLHPEMSMSRAVADQMSREFFASKDAMDFEQSYRKVINDFLSPPPLDDAQSSPSAEIPMPQRREGEGDDDYNKRIMQETAKSVVMKIVAQAQDVNDIGELLDIIKAMDKTGFFAEDMTVESPPMRYLPVTCSECEYKRFIDAQVKEGNIEEV